MKLIEIRTYKLKPGYAEQFAEAMDRALALVRASMDVVAFGRSDHEQESFYLIRAYDSREALEKQQDAFYSSEAWRSGPRQALVECIEHYLNTLVWMSASAVEDVRKNNGAAGGNPSGS